MVPRSRAVFAALLGAALLLAGCGDDGDDIATGDASTEADGADGVEGSDASDPCADLEASVLKVVEDPGPADDRSEDDPPPPEEIAAYEAAGPALQRLADQGPEELRADAAALAEIFATPYDEVTQEQGEAMVEPADRLVAWGAEACDLDAPVWRCTDRATFRTVGAPIDAGPGLGFDSPEAVVDTAQVEPGWERVEVERTVERVTFAWVDGDGFAARSETARAVGDGGWTSDQTTTCDTSVDLEPEDGAAVETVPEPLPPASSTSVP